jgi:hypothetical protein
MRKSVAPRLEKLVNEVRNVAPSPLILNCQIRVTRLQGAFTCDDDPNDGLLSILRK